jgi:hypothetical protein|eukprot:COSAG02_NODE_6604_length_3466_cov_3.836650_2_plen_87_part_00
MAQLEQWVPAEELASGIGALLAEEGLSAEAKVDQIRAYAAQRGIPISASAGESACAPRASVTTLAWSNTLMSFCATQETIVRSSKH